MISLSYGPTQGGPGGVLGSPGGSGTFHIISTMHMIFFVADCAALLCVVCGSGREPIYGATMYVLDYYTIYGLSLSSRAAPRCFVLCVVESECRSASRADEKTIKLWFISTALC